MGIRGFHSWEWMGTGIPAHPWGGYAECGGSLSTLDTTGYSITRFPIVLERSARLNLDLERVDKGDRMMGRMGMTG